MAAAPHVPNATLVPDELCFDREHWSHASTSEELKNELANKAFALRTRTHLFVGDGSLIREVAEKKPKGGRKNKQPKAKLSKLFFKVPTHNDPITNEIVYLFHRFWETRGRSIEDKADDASLGYRFGLEGLPESASVGTAFVAVIDAVGEKDWHPFWKFSKGNGLFTLMYGTDPTKNLRGFLDALIRAREEVADRGLQTDPAEEVEGDPAPAVPADDLPGAFNEDLDAAPHCSPPPATSSAAPPESAEAVQLPRHTTFSSMLAGSDEDDEADALEEGGQHDKTAGGDRPPTLAAAPADGVNGVLSPIRRHTLAGLIMAQDAAGEGERGRPKSSVGGPRLSSEPIECQARAEDEMATFLEEGGSSSQPPLFVTQDTDACFGMGPPSSPTVPPFSSPETGLVDADWGVARPEAWGYGQSIPTDAPPALGSPTPQRVEGHPPSSFESGLDPLQGDLLEDFGLGRADESPGFAAGLQTHEPPGLLQGAPHQTPAQRHDQPMTTPSAIDKSPIAGIVNDLLSREVHRQASTVSRPLRFGEPCAGSPPDSFGAFVFRHAPDDVADPVRRDDPGVSGSSAEGPGELEPKSGVPAMFPSSSAGDEERPSSGLTSVRSRRSRGLSIAGEDDVGQGSLGSLSRDEEVPPRRDTRSRSLSPRPVVGPLGCKRQAAGDGNGGGESKKRKSPPPPRRPSPPPPRRPSPPRLQPKILTPALVKPGVVTHLMKKNGCVVPLAPENVRTRAETVVRELGVTIPVLPADELPGHDKYSNLADKSEAEHDKDERANLHTRRFTRPDNAARTLVYRIAITAGYSLVFKVYPVRCTDDDSDYLDDFYHELAVLLLGRGVLGFVQLVAVGVSEPAGRGLSQQTLILVLEDMGSTLLEFIVKDGPLHMSHRYDFRLAEFLYYIIPAMIDLLMIQHRLLTVPALTNPGVKATIWDVKLENFCGALEWRGKLPTLRAFAIDADSVILDFDGGANIRGPKAGYHARCTPPFVVPEFREEIRFRKNAEGNEEEDWEAATTKPGYDFNGPVFAVSMVAAMLLTGDHELWPFKVTAKTYPDHIREGLESLDAHVRNMLATSSLFGEPGTGRQVLEELVTLLKAMMALDPEARPSYAEAAAKLEALWERLRAAVTGEAVRAARLPPAPSFVVRSLEGDRKTQHYL